MPAQSLSSCVRVDREGEEQEVDKVVRAERYTASLFYDSVCMFPWGDYKSSSTPARSLSPSLL